MVEFYKNYQIIVLFVKKRIFVFSYLLFYTIFLHMRSDVVWSAGGCTADEIY